MSADTHFCFGCKNRETATVREARNQLTFCGAQCQSAFYAAIGGNLLMLQTQETFGIDAFLNILKLHGIDEDDDDIIDQYRWSLVDSMIVDGTVETRKRLLKWIETDKRVQKLLFYEEELNELKEVIRRSVIAAAGYNLPALLLVINLHGMTFYEIFGTEETKKDRWFKKGVVKKGDETGASILWKVINIHRSIRLLDVLLRKLKFPVDVFKFYFEDKLNNMFPSYKHGRTENEWQKLLMRLSQELSPTIQQLFEQFFEFYNTLKQKSTLTPNYEEENFFIESKRHVPAEWEFGRGLASMYKVTIKCMVAMPDHVWMPKSAPDKRAKRGR